MIKRLKRKFILINMSLVTLVLLIVFLSMTLSNWRQGVESAERTLKDALAMSTDDAPALPEIGKGRTPGVGRGNSAPAFLTVLDQSEQISQTILRNATVSDEVIAGAVSEVLAGGKSGGMLMDYELRYAVRYSSAGMRIAFVDMSGGLENLRRQVLVSLVIDLGGLAAFFGISLFLSGWALAPAERAWERQRQFVADASHELKTPLTVILANMDILLSHPESQIGEQRRWVENTRTEGLRMKDLVEDMLYLAKADVAVVPDMAPMSLSDAVWSAVLPFEAVAFEKGVTIQTEITEGLTVAGSEPGIKQLTAILMDNAVKYAGERGVVTVTLKETGEGPALFVHNTGAPIDKEDLPHLFERFYRTEAARNRTAGGYGLGLAIAQSIAQQHRAVLGVKSGEGEGTTFFVEWKGR